VKNITKFFTDLGIEETTVLAVLAAVAFFGLIFGAPDLGRAGVSWAILFLPAWLPLVLLYWLSKLWVFYVRQQYIAGQDTILLEIKIPRDIDKSPRAMEAVFSGLHIGPGEGTFVDRLIKGQVRPWWSFELVSLEGRIHFYVWTRAFFKEYVETQIYAQYPEVEIFEVEDYIRQVPYNPEKHSLWGCDFKLGGKDAYPIKTYVDYQLDKDPKEEYKIDPIAHLFEYLSSLKKGEYAFIQVMIRTNKDKRKKPGTWFEKEDRWKAEAKEEVDKIYKEATPTLKDKDGKESPGLPSLRTAQKEKVEAIDRSLDKQGFDTGIRGIYMAEKDSFKGIRIAGLTGVFKQFSSSHLNSIVPTGWFTTFSFEWQSWFGAKAQAAAGIFDAYAQRSWFHPPYDTPAYVMTTEELATIYHFPSRTVQAPGLERLPSTKAEAPPNLPI